jgi:hypothetical protein
MTQPTTRADRAATTPRADHPTDSDQPRSGTGTDRVVDPTTDHPTTPIDRPHRPAPQPRSTTTPTTGQPTAPVAPAPWSTGPDRWTDRVARSAANHPTDHRNPTTKPTGTDRLRLVPPVAALGTAFVVQTVAVTDVVGGALAGALTGSPVHWLATHAWLGYATALLLGIAVACCFEGGGAYLMDLYDKHLMARDSVWVLRLAMLVYVSGSAAAIHWWTSHRHLPEVTSWLLAGMTASALFLWSRGSRWRNREAMRAAGQLDPALPKLPAAAKFWHPIRSLNTVRLVSWEPVATTDEARTRYDTWRHARSTGTATTHANQVDATATNHPTTPAANRPTTAAANHPTGTDHPDRPTTPAAESTTTTDQTPDHPTTPVDEPVGATAVVDPTTPTTLPEPITPVDRPAATPRSTAKPTTDQATRRPLRVVGESAAAANARLLRQRYGDQLPASARQIRRETGWSKDRVDHAVEAYLSGADLRADDDSTNGGTEQSA